jgi:phosphatidylglycerophosphate synthase
MSDASFAAVLMVAGLVLAVIYGARVMLRGEAHYERVERMGASALLGKRWLEMGYWALQPVARGCIALGITANALTWISLLLGALAGVALAEGRFGLAALLALASNLCDALDGLVARSTNTASDAGEVLDATVDRYNEFFFFAGLIFFYQGTRSVVALTLAALAGSFMVSYSTAKAEALGVEAPRGAMRRPERSAYLIVGAALTPLAARALEPLPGAHAPVGLPMIAALAIVALAANFSAIHRLWAIARAVRAARATASGELSAAGVEPASSEMADKSVGPVGLT